MNENNNNGWGTVPPGYINPLDEIKKKIPAAPKQFSLRRDDRSPAKRALDNFNKDILDRVSRMTWNQKRLWFDDVNREIEKDTPINKAETPEDRRRREEDEREYERLKKEQQELEAREINDIEEKYKYFPETAITLENMRSFRNLFGSFNEDRHATQISERTGEKDLLDGAILGADIHEKLLDLRRQAETIKGVRKLLAAQYNFTPEKLTRFNKDEQTRRYLEIDRDLADELEKIEKELNDPNNIAAEKQYKNAAVAGVGTWNGALLVLKSTWNNIWDSMKSWSLNSVPGQAEHLKESVRQDRLNKIDTEYLDLLQKELSKKLEKGNYNGDIDLEVTKQFKKNANEEIKELQKEIQEMVVAKQKSENFWKVSQAYKEGKEIYQAESLWSPEYWIYTMPGMMGSSLSSPWLVAKMGLQGAGAVASLATGNPTAYNIATGVSAAIAIPGGVDENQAEAANKRTDNIKEFIAAQCASTMDYKAIMDDIKLKSILYWSENGLTKEEAEKRVEGEKGLLNAIQDLQGGFINSEHPVVKRALLCSTQGLASLFWANNARTIGETAIQTVLDLIPTGKFKAASRSDMEKGVAKLGEKVGVLEGKFTAKEGVRAAEDTGGRYVNGFRKKTISEAYQSGKEAGEAIGDAAGFGYFGSKVGGYVGGITAAGYRKIANSLPGTAGKILEDIEFGMSKKYQALSDFLSFGSNRARLLERYAARLGRKGIRSGFSEGAEEATQYLNSKENFDDYGIPSIQDLIVNDIKKGSDIFNFYLSYLGLSDSQYLNDKEFIENWKGGFALGGAHTVANTFIPMAVQDYKTYKASNFLWETGVMNREWDSKDRSAGVQFAKAAMDGNAARVMETLNSLEAADKRRKNPEYTQEDYDDRRHMAQSIMSMALNNNIKEVLKERGIEYGTDKYAYAVANMYQTMQKARANQDAVEANAAYKDVFYSSKDYQDALDEAVSVIEAVNPQYHQNLANSMEEAEAAVRKNRKESPTDVSESDVNEEVKVARNDARVAYREQVKGKMLRRQQLLDSARALVHIIDLTKSVSDVYSLLSKKFGLKTSRPDAKIIDKHLKNELSRIKQEIKRTDPQFDEKMSNADLLNYVESEDIVRHNSEEADRVNMISTVLDAERAVTERQSALAFAGVKFDDDGNIIENKPSDTAKNMYGRYIDAVIKADKDNEALEWMVGEMLTGDAVTQIQEEFEKENAKRLTDLLEEMKTASEKAQRKAQRQKEKEQLGAKAKFGKNKEKWARKKAAAKAKYLNRKKKYKNWKRGSLSASIVPLQDLFVDFINKAVQYVEEGVYSIALFIEDANDVFKDAKLDELKQAYIRVVSDAARDNDLDKLNKLSTLQEVVKHALERRPIVGTPPPQDEVTKDVQQKLDEAKNNIDEDLTTFYDLFANENGEVHIYPYHSSLDDYRRSGYVKYSDRLKAANTSEESFKEEVKKIIDEISLRFPEVKTLDLNKYIKYRNLNGIEDAILRAILDYAKFKVNTNRFVENSINIREDIAKILLGQENDVHNEDVSKDFIDKIKSIKTRIERSGYTIMNVDRRFYGEIDFGIKTMVCADIIAVNKETGDMMIGTITSSYKNPEASFDEVSKYTGRTRRQQETERLNLIALIAIRRFGLPVRALFTIPVEYEKGRPAEVYDIKSIQKTFEPVSFNVEEYKKLAEEKLLNLNDVIDEYNQYVDTLKSYNGVKLLKEPRRDIQEYNTDIEYQDYIRQLDSSIEDISQKKAVLKTEVENRESEQDIFDAEIEKYEALQDNIEIQYLWDACKALDVSLQYLPIGPATTEDEIANLKQIYRSIFDAQDILNEFLFTNKINSEDIQLEMQLIMSAIEKVVRNQQQFQTISHDTMKLWLDGFIPDTNRGNAQAFSYYTNSINNWVKSISLHVLNDIDNNYSVLVWYSTLLNNFFQELVNRASEFAATLPEIQKDYVNDVARRGQRLIDTFNLEYGVEPDSAYKAPAQTELELINRMPVKWLDYYGVSNKHTPSYDAIEDLSEEQKRIFYYITNAVDLLQDYEAVDDPRKIPGIENKKTKFILHLDKNGELRFTVTYGNNSIVDLPFFVDVDSHDGDKKEYAKRFNRGNRKFERAVREKLRYIKEHPEENLRLTFTVTRNKGRMRYSSEPGMFHVLLFLFKNDFNKHDLYNIKVSEEDGIGTLMRRINKTTGKESYDVYAGGIRIGGFDEEYNKAKLALYKGALVYFYKNGDGTSIGTLLSRAAIGDNATDIARLIYRYAVNSLETVNKDGASYNILQLLNQVVYLHDPNKRLSEYNSTNNMLNVVKGNPTVYIGTTPYVLTDDQQRNDFIQRLSQMEYVTSEVSLNETMQNSRNSVIQLVIQQIRSGKDSVLLPNGFTITKDDVVNNSTWFGYMLRNGYIGTKVMGNSYRRLNISNVQAVPIDNEKSTPLQIKKHAEVNPRDSMRKLFGDNKSGGLAMAVDEDELIERTESEKAEFESFARSYFELVFGTSDDLAVVDKITDKLGILPKSKVAAGVTTDTLVQLAKNAPETAVWHEAFHKLMELVLTKELRDEYYKAYRNRRKFLLKGGYRNLSEREVAEGLADTYIWYMTKKGKINKKDGFIGTLSSLYNKITLLAGMYYRFGRKNTKRFFLLYADMNSGKFKENTIAEENKERFLEQFLALYYSVKNNDTKQVENFTYLHDSSEIGDMVRGLSYIILDHYGMIKNTNANPRNIVLDHLTVQEDIGREYIAALTGAGKPESQLTSQEKAFREVFHEEHILQYDEKGRPYYVKSYPKFDVLKLRIKDYISSIVNAHGHVFDDDTQNDEDEKVQNANIDKFDRSSVEFDKLESVAQKIKLFFSTIPYSVFEEDENGQLSLEKDFTKNIFGFPEFMPLNEVYKQVTADLHDVNTIDELNFLFKRLAEHSPMYRRIYDKWKPVYEGMYSLDEDFNIDLDKEAFCINMLKAIKSHASNFIIAYSDIVNGAKRVRIMSSSEERDSMMFSRQWNLFLTSGQYGIFNSNRINNNLVFRSQRDQTVFSDTALFVELLIQALTFSGETNVGGIVYDSNSVRDIEFLKDEFISRLNKIGIQFTKEALNNVLLNRYGGLGRSEFLRWITKKGENNDVTAFIQMLNNMAPKGVPNTAFIDTAYKDNGFVKHLANLQSAYNRRFRLNMALGLGGKKLYSITQNNSITHIVNAINSKDLNNATMRTLSNYGFNVTTQNDIKIGSKIMKNALDPKNNQHLSVFTYIGFKTDNRGDSGVEYQDTPLTEDYVAKLTMLQEGYLVFPTLADKSTYMIIKGVDLPGMRFSLDFKTVENVPTIMEVGSRQYLRPSDTVLDQMDEYAQTERLAIQQCMEDLGYDDIPGYQKQGRRVLNENEKIENLHTPNKDKNTGKIVEPNGTRFLSLTEIVVERGGKLIPINFNDPNKSSVDMLRLANEEYFSKSIEDRRKIMALTLNRLTAEEVKMAERIGLIERRDIQYMNEEPAILKTEKSIRNLENKNLNLVQILAVEQKLFADSRWSKAVAGSREYNIGQQVCHGLAIAAILQDASIRSIMSSQEVMRCFSGNPAQFKVDYDFERGRIKDSTYDIQKRIGGMVSTGEDNVTDLPYITSTYTCAELKDYEVASTSNVASTLEQRFIEGEVRDAYGVHTGDWKKAYSAKIEDLLESQEEYIAEAKKRGIKYANSYKGGINVADGAAYITAKMCLDLLRMRGVFTKDVQKAFKILNDPKTAYSWKDSKKAFDLIYKTLNGVHGAIVTTKYTAYGFRNHEVNGELSSDVAVAYYNKFALFPMFWCNSTGPMGDVYEKMLDEGVDMLMFDSAVKIGSQGAVKFENGEIKSPFNKYKQLLSFLRRQLNTDPEEGTSGTFGTQAVKIVMQNLRLKRSGDAGYVDSEDGSMRDGTELLHTLMGSINKLSDIGKSEVEDMFFKKDGTIDDKKLSDYLTKEMGTRNASVGIMDAVEFDEVHLRLNSPIAATTNSSWIQSIVIAMINKKVIDIVTPGGGFTQRSVFAIEKTRKSGEGSILSDKNIQTTTINGGEKLQMINEDGSMDAVISIDYFANILPEGLSFNEARQWLIDNNIIGKKAKASTIGYRIPTQAQSSIHALRFVDVVPATLATIILPEEFTKITGSDFDIDHLYLASYNYTKGADGKLTNNITKSAKEEENKLYYQNEILRVMMTLLKDSKSTNSLYKSIDNDTELPLSIAKLIPSIDSNKHFAYNFGTLHELVLRRLDFVTGKKGIGPFALNVTNQILTYLYEVKFAENEFTKHTRIKGLDNLLDKDDNYVSSWLSAFINGHVDIVKDPWVTTLDVNPYTYNILSLLIRSGYGENAVWFLCQPIIKELAEADQSVRSQYTKDRRSSLYRMRKDAEEAVLLKYLTESELSEENLSKYTKISEENEFGRANAVNNVLENLEKLRNGATKPNEIDKSFLRDVYYCLLTINPYANALNTFVQHTKIDTRKQGKSFLELYNYYNEYRKLFFPKREGLFSKKSLYDLAKLSWIDKKTKYGTQLPLSIFKNQMFEANDYFLQEITDAKGLLEVGEDNTKNLSPDALTLLSKSFITYIKSKYILDYAKNFLNMNDADLTGLFIGNRTISKRLNILKYAILNVDKYKNLANNSLLQYLEILPQDDKYNEPEFITVMDSVEGNPAEETRLIDGWKDLLDSNDRQVARFARDLIVYAFLSSGEFSGWNKLFKYVPPTWIRGEHDHNLNKPYDQYIREQLMNPNWSDPELLDMVVQNNPLEYMFSERVSLQDENKKPNYTTIPSKNGSIAVLIGKQMSPTEINEQPLYVTLKVGYGHSIDSYNVYKKVGYALTSKGKRSPIYVQLKKKGYSYKNNNVYEYGWQFNYNGNGEDFDILHNQDRIESIKNYIRKIGYGTVVLNGYLTQSAVEAAPAKAVDVEDVDVEEEFIPQVTISSTGYKKGDPQNNPDTNYAFTENAQAYLVARDKELPKDIPTVQSGVKLNVSDVNGTNQAGIRTDAQGNITKNAYGIIVKKYQQDASGNFVSKEGQFNDTEEDFELFKRLNEEVINKLQNGNDIIFPAQMALGKAALPWRFCVWLKMLLYDNFGIISTIENNKNSNYDGYGLSLQGTVDEVYGDSYYDWEYLEASYDSKTLNNLSPTIRVNGNLIARPRYKFGRAYITTYEKQYITEKVAIEDSNGNDVGVDIQKLSYVLLLFNDVIDHNGELYITIPYREWMKILLVDYKINPSDNTINLFLTLVYDELDSILEESDLIDTYKHNNYNKATKKISLDKSIYDLVRFLSENSDIVKSLYNMFGNKSNMYHPFYDTFDLILHYGMENNLDVYSLFENIITDNGFTPKYKYTDSRQLDLFDILSESLKSDDENKYEHENC